MSRRALLSFVTVPVAAISLMASVLISSPVRADDPAAPVVAVLEPTPVLLGLTDPPPHGTPGNTPWIPLVYPTLKVSARMSLNIIFRPAVVGETLIFSVGAKPTAADPDGGVELCRGVTDADGRVTCTGSKAATALLLSTLSGGAWVAHPASAGYAFSVEKLPLIG